MAGALVALVMVDTFMTGYLLVNVMATRKLCVQVATEYESLSDLVDLLPCNHPKTEHDLCVDELVEVMGHE